MQERDGLSAERAATIIQACFRGMQTRERVKKRVKDLFTRKMIIKELLDTEENYIRDLSIVISDFQTPLLNKKIISREESQAIFMNVDQIRRLNQLFFATIFEEASNYWHYKVIFEKVEKQVHFFKMYFDYFNNYSKSSTTIDSLMQKRAFADFIEEARLSPTHRLLSLKDYLIKPVQRLPKYVLIMKEIKRRTPPSHPDCGNIQRVLKMFEEVNHTTNQKLNRVLNTYKISEIEKKLTLPHTISEPGVQFVCEEPVTVITNEGLVAEATLYLLNTELIVARKSGRGEKFMVSIPFKNGGGNIMSNEEHFFYKDTFTVQNGEGDSCMFLCPEEEEREKLVQKIYNELMKAERSTVEKLEVLCNVKNKEGVQFLRKMSRLDLLPDVQILGTDERSDSMFKYTVYIVQIRIKVFRQKIFVRFKELLEVQQMLTEQYGLTLKNLLIKTTWVTNHKPKRIEERKMAIQRFLKEVLSKQEIIERGEDLLLKLGLPSDFYTLPQIYKDSEHFLKKSAIYQRDTTDQSHSPSHQSHSPSSSAFSKSKRSIFASVSELAEEEKQKQRPAGRQSRRLSIQDILKANELHLGHFTRFTQIMSARRSKAEMLGVDVLIPWIQNERGLAKQRIEVEKCERVLNLIEQLAKQLGLRYFKDFRVVLEREYACRILEDDECLAKVLQEVHCGKYLLILKKTIYVAPDIEEREIRGDRVRLKIIASQIIYDCKKDKYLLDYQLMLRLSALIGIAQLHSEQGHKSSEEVAATVREGEIAMRSRQLVCSSFTSFCVSPATWKQDYQAMFQLILDKLKSISRANHRLFRSSGLEDGEKEHNATQIGQLASVLIITSMKEKTLFGAISFVVQISQWFRQYLMRFGREEEDSYDNRNCWLIIKYDSMHLYSIALATRIFSFSYSQLYKIQTYPASILLYLRDSEIDFLKLKTTNSYTIREMLLYYKNYNDILNKIQEDQHFEGSIIQLVRENQREATLLSSQATLLSPLYE